MPEPENTTNNVPEETTNLLDETKVAEPKVEETKIEHKADDVVDETTKLVEEPKVAEPKVAEHKVEEPKVEHKADDVVEESSIELTIEDKKMVIGKLLADFLIDKTKVDKLKVDLNLSTQFLDFLSKITESYPELLNEIEKSLTDIVSDKVIDSNDIPKLVVLIKNVYKNFNDSNNFKKLFKITIEDSINFIKNILLILIELEHIKVKDKDSVIIIIDLCIDLLTTSVDVTETLISKFKSCFRC